MVHGEKVAEIEDADTVLLAFGGKMDRIERDRVQTIRKLTVDDIRDIYPRCNPLEDWFLCECDDR